MPSAAHEQSDAQRPDATPPDGSGPAPTILFAGGGTGGHLFPAIATAEALLAIRPDARCRFLCSPRPIDAEILSKQQLASAALDFEAIPAQPFGVRPRALYRFLTSWGAAVRAGREAIRRAKHMAGTLDMLPVTPASPVTIAAFGGFVAAPIVQAARVERVPIVMVNLDAIPGKANRWIARHATRVLTAAPAQGFAWERVRPIVRRASVTTQSQRQCRTALGLDPSRRVLLVTGGSQGAGSINAFLARFASEHAAALDGWQVLHQTGKEGVEAARDAYKKARVHAVVVPFIAQMGTAWGAADVALGRCGAGTVAEAWANAVPTLFMPYPYHKDQHQKFNAMALVEPGAALLATDHIDAARNVAEAGSLLQELLMDSSKRESLQIALRKLGPADGAQTVATALLGQVNAPGRR
jgi:UDP-N-acetylglucosamine--N-acetylmuramyl-(pentapeptide) pyrophosphoryl-undecaprenol N-acetylglucosamine transferase